MILTVDGAAVGSDSAWQALQAAHKPGDVVEVKYQARGRQGIAQVVFAEDPRLEVVTYEEAGRPVTDAMHKFRKEWLGVQN